MNYYQEAVDFNTGRNFLPCAQRYRLPDNREDTTIFLLSDSFEYDIQLIKHIPHPKTNYKNIIIPFRVMDKIGIKPFSYNLNNDRLVENEKYLIKQRLFPNVTSIKYPYPATIKQNLYVSMSDLFKEVTPQLRGLSTQALEDSVLGIFKKILNHFNYSKTKVMIIDVSRYKIYQTIKPDNYKNDLLNGLITLFGLKYSEELTKLNVTFIFRTKKCDYQFIPSLYEQRDVVRFKSFISSIGVISETSAMTNEEAGDSVDSFDEDVVTMGLEEDEDKNATSSISDSLSKLKSKLTNVSTEPKEDDSLYNAKTFNINSQLMHRINPVKDIISNYKTIANEISPIGDNNPVEKGIIDDAAKTIAMGNEPINEKDVMNTTTSAREEKIRKQIGQLKLKNVTLDTITSVVDVPKPPGVTPNRITTTNPGALKGTQFGHIAKEYEDKLMDADIVSTFMNLSKFDNGFYIKNVDVTDVSTVTSLTNNWKVTLVSKNTEKANVVNLRVPRLFNGRFYNNGIWYNIGKQDFPIPILKVSKKRVILTTNYNKITVDRYDTRSLLDLSTLIKVMNTCLDDTGKNKYVMVGSSIATNSHYETSIEYDEYAKRWLKYSNPDHDIEVHFNRQNCSKLYSFVTVNDHEFCCGMINKVPIVIDTDTSLTRDGSTLTDIILATLPEDKQTMYSKTKPGKMSMYSEITIGATFPLGVAVAAWEGLSSLLKKCKCDFKYVDKSFTDTKYFTIPFKDKVLAIENKIQNQLIFNGFYRINTKGYMSSDFDKPIMDTNSVFIDIFNQLFFKQYSQLTTFITYYNFFVDAVTANVCDHFNIPNDIAGMLLYASNLLADNGCGSEEHSSLYRIRSSEIVPAIIHYHLAIAISKHINVVGSKAYGNNLTINPNVVINELLAVPNVEPMSALNPIVELHARETVTKKGFKGVNSDRAFSLDKRGFNDSMIGKMGISSPNSGTIGINRQLVVDPKLESVRGYTSTKTVDDDYNDLQLASFSELLTPGTVTRDDAVRTAIATSQSAHMVSTTGAEPVLISNGVDEIAASYLTDEFIVNARLDGKVLEITDGYMIVEYTDKTKQAVPVLNRYSFNSGSGFYIDNLLIPNFQPGESFKKNDVLAFHQTHFSKDSTGVVRMNIGPVMKVAFTGIYSTYEDAGIITESASKLLETKLSMKQTLKLNATDDIDHIVKVGDEIEINDPLLVFGLGDTGDKAVDNFLKAFADKAENALESAKKIIKSDHAGTVVAVRMYTIKSMDKLSPSLYKILDEYFKDNTRKRKILDKHDKSDSVYKLDTFYDLPTGPLKGSSIKGITTDVLIEIIIEHADEVSIGDKLAIYGASKQINSEVVPKGFEPYAESKPNEEISVFVAPSAVFKRMIPSLMITASGNKVLIELKEQVAKIWNGN